MAKTKLEIIDETVAFYGEDTSRRSTTPKKGCKYYNEENGNMCAVGRCLTEDGLSRIHEKEGYGIIYFGIDGISNWFKDEYKDHSISFWDDLQVLHDNNRNWVEGKGLTKLGKEYVEELKEKWKN